MQPIGQRSSLPDQVAQVLRENLAGGLWKDHLPAERVLSEQLGVSRPSLRAALGSLRREGWIEVMQGCPTRILAPPSRPPERRTNVVLLTPVPLPAMPPFVLYWLDELRDKLAASSCPLEIHVARTCYNPQPARALESIVHCFPAAAWIIYLSTGPMQRWFQEQALPCLVAGTCAEGVKLPSVDVDYRATCRHATGWLFTHKRRRIALVLPAVGQEGDAESEQGFCEAFASTRTKDAAAFVLRHDGTPLHITTVLDGALRTSEPPDGFIVARSADVITVVTHLQRRGIRLPNDAMVVSRDGDAFLESIMPPIPRYAPNPGQFAHRISRAALELAKNGVFSTRPVRLLAKFVEGVEN